MAGDEVLKLQAAREARNYLGHEAASFNIHNLPEGTSLREAVGGKTRFTFDERSEHLGRMRIEVPRLAVGDKVISQ
jgi:hypothetical protein